MGKASISAAQLRAARALLRWTLNELAEKAEVSVNSITRYETELATPRRATLMAIRQAFEAVGVEFIGNGVEGVQRKKPSPQPDR
jgi:transcriptional regulator with XRE-family HTH domain